MAHYRTRMARGERGVVAPAQPIRRRRRGRDDSSAAATRLGIPVEQYRANVKAGQKWCSGHREWHRLATTPWMGDRSKRSGLAGSCTAWGREYVAARRAG